MDTRGNNRVVYSRKVFVGGLPVRTTENELRAVFSRYGNVSIDWPYKQQSVGTSPSKGYAFLLFKEHCSVEQLIASCVQRDDRLYLELCGLRSHKDKQVQIRPWRIGDAVYLPDQGIRLDPRKTVFVGGVPRPMKAVELARVIADTYSNVCYVEVDTDPEFHYPKGAARVTFLNNSGFYRAIAGRFVTLHYEDHSANIIKKVVELKPYVLDNAICDNCLPEEVPCPRPGPLFCPNIQCLQYFCVDCWHRYHTAEEHHKPLVKDPSSFK